MFLCLFSKLTMNHFNNSCKNSPSSHLLCDETMCQTLAQTRRHMAVGIPELMKLCHKMNEKKKEAHGCEIMPFRMFQELTLSLLKARMRWSKRLAKHWEWSHFPLGIGCFLLENWLFDNIWFLLPVAPQDISGCFRTNSKLICTNLRTEET